MTEQLQSTVDNLQTQLSAVQAAIDGSTNSSLFKQPPFNGFKTEDINEWLAKFEKLSKLYSWTNAKRLGALPLMLGGPALAWYQTLPSETANDFPALIVPLKERFRAQNLDLFLRQELYACKQGLNEPLAMFTEDIIKRCQRLSLLDVEMMNISINGLKKEIKNNVILNQPKSFAEADNLARLRAAFSSTSVSENQTLENVSQQEQRIKELEGQVNLLLTFQKQQPKPVHALDSSFEANCPFQNGPNDYSNAFTNMSYGYNPFRTTKPDMIAAIDNRFQQPVSFGPQYAKRSFQYTARGRNLRTTDGQPICNFCQRVRHVSRYCRQRQSNQNQHQPNTPFQHFQPLLHLGAWGEFGGEKF